MNLFYKISFYLICLSFFLPVYSSDTVVTLFLQKYPYFKLHQKKSYDPEKYSKKLRQPTYVYKKITQSNNFFSHGAPGISCLYAGRIALSDPNGQVTFPRQQQTRDMHILVTKGIQPAYMIAPATVHNWMLDSRHPSEIYKMTFKHDPKTTLQYYETTKHKLTNNNIPLNTIILIADPENIFIPMGATVIDSSPNIVLPIIYIKKGFCFVYNSLYTLAIKQYFEQTESTLKQDIATIAKIEQIT